MTVKDLLKEMSIEEAEEIVNLYERYNPRSCTCFQGHPPCGKCENTPSEEDYKEALQRIERGW